MTTGFKVVSIPANSETSRLLARAAAEPLLIQSNGERYRVTRADDDPFAGYDPDRARAALDRVFGLLPGIDREALKQELRESRDQDSAGRPA